ncbi:hypothetical protein DICPUDRAFT_148975 [Dictyostelium purpureum]|uniref:Uncharacterized protein n=1 Tax=Dictyostelium purpureum TaxID=5786 RepID=F0ZCH4_DICPU|nr:uncharacterized protein DICPUDRAFT_148975 [Dictyostelium purpureum]EGC38345.1 hypothetical protein DICPUDRAFT_148975 [Dictyostelium purpureum]|eukprot:XP_003285102.1 hypothetical protein DICPUDRAFT_148975 [Dictyostelium purpureum]
MKKYVSILLDQNNDYKVTLIATYGDINQKYNNSLNINNSNNNSSHHRHDNDKPHYNHNYNSNSNSKEKKSSKNSFYDYINSDDNIKRKLSDLDDAELDDIVESFEAKKQSSKKNFIGSVSKSSSNSINKNHRDSKKQTSSNYNNNNNSNIILSPISSNMLSPTPTESSKIPSSISPTLTTPKITTVTTTTIATTTTSTSTSTTTAIKTVNQNMWVLGTDQLLLKDNSMYKDVVLEPLHKKRKKKKSNEEKRDKEVSRLLLIPSNVNNFVPTIEYKDILIDDVNEGGRKVNSLGETESNFDEEFIEGNLGGFV